MEEKIMENYEANSTRAPSHLRSDLAMAAS
jgi:hypothetical protein